VASGEWRVASGEWRVAKKIMFFDFSCQGFPLLKV